MGNEILSFEDMLAEAEDLQEEAKKLFENDLVQIIEFEEKHKSVAGKHKYDIEVKQTNIEIKSRPRSTSPNNLEPIENVNYGDENAHENGYFTEIRSMGWIYNEDIDWILFFYPHTRTKLIRYCSFKELRTLFEEIENQYSQEINKPTRAADGNVWCSGFKRIPWKKIKEKCYNSGTMYKPSQDQTTLADYVLPHSNWRLKNQKNIK